LLKKYPEKKAARISRQPQRQHKNPVLQGGGWGENGSNPKALRSNPRRENLRCAGTLKPTPGPAASIFPCWPQNGLKRDLSDFHHSNAFGVLLDRSIAALIASRRTQRHKPFMVYPPE